MRRGDVVQLRQSIEIHSGRPEIFTHGIIAARIKAPTVKTLIKSQTEETSRGKSVVNELIIYLFNPDTSKICLDEEGVPILFDVQLSEVELLKAVKKRQEQLFRLDSEEM